VAPVLWLVDLVVDSLLRSRLSAPRIRDHTWMSIAICWSCWKGVVFSPLSCVLAVWRSPSVGSARWFQ